MILDSFPDLPFVLIGDSGERDPEIYRDIVKEYPARIRAIYIRSINKHPSRLAAIDRLIEEIRHTDSQLVLTPDSEFAAAHARRAPLRHHGTAAALLHLCPVGLPAERIARRAYAARGQRLRLKFRSSPGGLAISCLISMALLIVLAFDGISCVSPAPQANAAKHPDA